MIFGYMFIRGIIYFSSDIVDRRIKALVADQMVFHLKFSKGSDVKTSWRLNVDTHTFHGL